MRRLTLIMFLPPPQKTDLDHFRLRFLVPVRVDLVYAGEIQKRKLPNGNGHLFFKTRG